MIKLNKIKKVMSILLCVILVLINIISCANKNTDIKNSNLDNNENKKVKIVTTIFPIYDIVRNIVPSDKYDISMLLDSGIDIHNFQPTVQDMNEIRNADIFIYIGSESDKWVDKVLKSVNNENLKSINLMENISHIVKIEEIVEGMEHEHDEHSENEEEHHEEHDENHEHEEEHEHENDEHIWLSIRNVKEITKFLWGEFSLNKDNTNFINEDVYKNIENNATKYLIELEEIDNKYEEALKNKKYDTLVFADRFPFRYLCDDYNLKYFAAFSGCSAESEASFETVAFLAKKVDELNLPHICAILGSTHKIPQTVVNTTKDKNQDIIYFNSMEGISDKNNTNINYINIMEENLDALKKALN